jgi:PAS domain S-box-containing protein
VQDYAIFLLDETGHVLSWNTGARRIKGYTAQEIIGQHFSIFYPEEDLAWDKPGYELRVAAQEGKFEDEGWRLRKDGTRFWANVIITALFDSDGTLRGYGKVTRDLTERREAEETLRRSEETFRMIVANVIDYAIFMLDTEGNVRTWNAGAQRLKGWSADEISGQHFSTFYPEEDRETPPRLLEVARRDGRVEAEGWRVRKDGSRFWANVVITALYDDDGVLRGFGKVTRDLTDRKEAELARERFIANAAHELRTPLAVIIGFATHLKNPKAVNDPEYPELVDALARQSSRMRTLVNNLLDMTQLGQRRMTLSLESVRLDRSVERALQTAPAPDGKKVDAHIPPIEVKADAARLDQVVTNLLSNAYRYGGDRVEMFVTDDDPDRVMLHVKDNGVGIADDVMAGLFEPFKRGHPHQRIEGSGLGLAISKGIAEAFGGTIDLLPNDPGAHFRIILPKGDAA